MIHLVQTFNSLNMFGIWGNLQSAETEEVTWNSDERFLLKRINFLVVRSEVVLTNTLISLLSLSLLSGLCSVLIQTLVNLSSKHKIYHPLFEVGLFSVCRRCSGVKF